METLPPEILHNILAPEHHTTNESYLGLRLVCSSFRDIITPHAFANLCITDDECSLDRLSAVAGRKDLSPLVRTYTFHFSEPHCIAASTKKDYLKLISLEDSLYAEALQSHTPACRSQISHLTKIRTFHLSGDLESVHVKLLSSSFPNLSSVHITVHPTHTLSNMLPNLNPSMVSSSSSWGPLVFRAFFAGLAGRAESGAGLKPIETISVDGLSEDCVFLSPGLVDRVVVGMRAIQDATFSLTVVQSVYDKTTPTWLYLVGRFLQAAKHLKSLSLRSSHFPSLSALVHFRAIISPATRTPSVHHWKNLSRLYLIHAFIPHDLFKQFLTLHKQTLTDITLHSCDMQFPYKLYPSTPLESDPPPAVEPWSQIFRHMCTTNAPFLTHLSLRFLSSGVTPHDHHLPQSFVGEWESYIRNHRDGQSAMAEPTIDEDYLDCETLWCVECTRNSFDSEAEDGDEDSGTDGESVFGFGYPGWAWEDFDDEDEGEDGIVGNGNGGGAGGGGGGDLDGDDSEEGEYIVHTTGIGMAMGGSW